MKQKNKFAFIGGDERTLYAASYLAENGCGVAAVGFDCKDYDISFLDAVSGAACVILPITQGTDAVKTASGDTIRVRDIVDATPADALFFGGPKIYSVLRDVDASRVCDITKNEKFAERNADLTAEGAIGIIINALPFSVRDMRAAVLGYGRIGRSLAGKLCALGADVTVAARREEIIAEASKICRATHFDMLDLGAFDCMINTVPAKTLDGAALGSISGDTYIIELASPPGGFDDDIKSLPNGKFINAQGLPGKTAPASAGAAMAEAVLDILKEKK